MKPSEVGFNGTKEIGLNLKGATNGGVFQLRKGEIFPLDYYNKELENQLLWHCPIGKEPRLIYCNENNELFEVDFKPITLDMLNL